MNVPDATGPITPDLAGLRRLERRIARSLSLRAAGGRWLESLPAIIQITVAAVASFAVAHYLLGHDNPILAVTVTITSLGFNRDARPVRVLRAVLAILLGVLLATGIVVLTGQGIWQLAVVLVVVFSVARLLVRDTVFATSAATPASLAAVLPVPAGGPFLRVEDAAVAAVISLLVTILIPRSTRRIAERDGRAVFSVVSQATAGVADALAEGAASAAELALARLRRAQPLVDAWSQSLDTARSVARISPWLRPRLPELERAQRALAGCDAAIRHLRLIARRAESLTRAGEAHPAVAGFVAGVARGIELLGAEQEDLSLVGAARSLLADLAARLDPATLDRPSPAETALLLQLRPLVVDLLVATGLTLPEAQARLVAL